MSAADGMSSAHWLSSKDRLDEAFHLHASDATRGTLWAMILVLPIAVVLHSAAAFKRSQLGSFWLIRVDTEGYLQENRNVLMPTLSAIKTTLAIACVISLEHDFRTHLHISTIILQNLAFCVMHSLNWLRTWGSIYSMPPTSLFNFNKNRTKSPFQTNDRVFMPWLFNLFLLAGLLYGIVLALISTIAICTSLNRVNHLYHTLSEALDQNIALSENATSESHKLIKHNAALLHEGMQEMQSQSVSIFSHMQIMILSFLAINFLSILLFWWSLHTIIRCLNAQLEAYKRSLQNRSEAIQLGMVSERETTLANVHMSRSFDASDDLGSLEVHTKARNSKNTTESIYSTWRMWLPTLQRNTVVADHFLWKSPLMGQVTPQGPNHKGSIRRQYVLLRRFKINTLWQAISITLMAISYQAMGITLKANAFDVPRRTSVAEAGMIVTFWSNLIWAVGGTTMAALSAVVAYSGTSTCNQNNVHEVQLEEAKSFDY